MVSAKDVGSELRKATTLSAMSVTGLAVLALVAVGVFLVFRFADVERDRALRAWEDRLGAVAETRAAALDGWMENQFETLRALADNASLQIYLTEIAAAGPAADAEAQRDYLRNLMSVVADRDGFTTQQRGPDVDANVDRVAVDGLALLDAAGAVVVATRGMPPLAGGLYGSLLAPPRGGRGFLDMHRSAVGPLVIGFSVPVFGVQQDPGQARPLGRIVGLRRAEDGVFPLLRQPGFAWKSADTYLVRRTGATIEYLSPRHGDRAPLTGARQADDAGLAAADAVRGVRFGIADTYAGEPSVFAARALSAAPWTVIASVARDEALGPADSRRFTTVAALLAAIAVAVVAIVAVWRHGTSLRAAEAASRYRDMAHRYEAQSRFLRLVADSQPHPMFIVDGEGRFRFANRAAAEQAETSDADMIGKSLTSVLGAAEARRYEETNREVMSSRAIQSRIHRSGSNGDLRVVQSEYIPVADGPDFDDGILIVEQDITRAIKERENRMAALRQLVRTLLAAVDSRDPYAANHSMQVAVVARAVAEEMGLDDVEVDTAEIAGSLMNVGKLLVPTDLLTRPGQLSDEELGKVREAIDTGVSLLADVPFEGPVVETLRQMGERWDGAGQPRGLSGTEILATARIVAVANAFVAMLNPRAWRPGSSFDDAVEALLADAGSAFDRSVVAALINRLENRGGRQDWAHLVNAVSAA